MLVTFAVEQDDGWPPVDVEQIECEPVSAGLVRIATVPLFLDDASVGDVVRHPDGVGPHRLELVESGRHSTVRIAATDVAQLVDLRESSLLAGRLTALNTSPAILAVDLPDTACVEDLLVVLDLRCSLTLTYSVSALRHRLTTRSPLDPGPHPRASAQVPAFTIEPDIRGRVVLPSDADWDEVRQAWLVNLDQRPSMVVEVADAFDVQAVLRYAAARGLRVAPQSTGHGASALGDLNGTILLRTRRLDAVEVDAHNRSIRVGAGAIWADVSAALAPHGLVALAGSAPDVGVAGYSLGGGYSWLGRRYGLASSSITAVELVTGDGTFHRVDAQTEPELFWAVRGGGANVGVVVALELEVYPIAEVYAGALFFPLERAAEVLPAYAAWTRDLDEAATTCIRLLRIPPLPELPEPLRGNSFVVIDGAVDAPVEIAEALLAPMRELGPSMDTWATMPATGLGAIHMDPPGPVPAAGDGISLQALTPEVIEILLAHAGPGADCSLLLVDLRHLGGALSRPDPRGGAIDHLEGDFLVYAVGIAPTPEVERVVRRDAGRLVSALQPHAAARDYCNFREVRVAPDRLFGSADLARLQALRASLDPSGLVQPHHAIA